LINDQKTPKKRPGSLANASRTGTAAKPGAHLRIRNQTLTAALKISTSVFNSPNIRQIMPSFTALIYLVKKEKYAAFRVPPARSHSLNSDLQAVRKQ
jgi:hypothetical protein